LRLSQSRSMLPRFAHSLLARAATRGIVSLFSLRTLLERLLRPLRFRRRLPATFGGIPIVVSPSAGLKFAFRSSERLDPELLRSARRLVRPGDVVWDVGANVGLFSYASAYLAGTNGRVLAFEPDTWLVALLRQSSRLQPDTSAPVEILPVAIAASEDIRRFSISRRSRAASFLSEYGGSQTGGTSETHSVLAVSLDWLCMRLPNPSVIKIDVEGAELEVLQGAAHVIRALRPRFLVEVSSANAPEIARILLDSGYDLYDGEEDPELTTPIREARWSTVAVPR